MLLKSQHHFLTISFASTLIGLFGCSQDRFASDSTQAAQQAVSATATTPEELQIEIVLKNEQKKKPTSLEQAPAATSQPTAATTSQPMAAAAAGNRGNYASFGGAGFNGGAGFGGGPAAAAGAPGLPGAPGTPVAAPAAAGLGFGPGPWDNPLFGPAFPFYVSDVVVVDDEDHWGGWDDGYDGYDGYYGCGCNNGDRCYRRGCGWDDDGPVGGGDGGHDNDGGGYNVTQQKSQNVTHKSKNVTHNRRSK